MFCSSCGTAIAQGAKFCSGCGAAQAAPVASVPAAPVAAQPQAGGSAAAAAPAPAPPSGSNTVLKILMGILAFFAFVCLALLATCGYIGYRANQRLNQLKADFGVDQPAGKRNVVAARDVCTLLTKEEVSEATGVAITEANGTTSECTYASATNPTVVQTNVTWQDGRLAYRMQTGSLKVISGGDQVIVAVPGIGDEALMIGLKGAEHADMQRDANADASGAVKAMMNVMGQAPLFFRKGNVMGQIGVSEARDTEEAKKALAAKMAQRI